ncbi:abortive phage infection protein [Pseudomonas sp. HLS-6]|uniref:AAA family ATPase n=1 Tax=Pseudomonas sp. HLS-6 TaxID=2049589 RepID=UPI000C1835BF|nr:ATP-binding protein [Pseudomonas sp. HLS-6]ATR83018.1 abortive phage infection protein [Pseudomonas sp. HLS-6]
MIIDFTVGNFRSIRDEQTLSMNVENPKSHLLSNICSTNNDKVNILRTAGIFGANASGKSNILLGLVALDFLISSTDDLKEGAAIPCYEPYCLSKENANAPISFEVEFLNADGLRYNYAISFTKYKIISESLDFYPTRQKANIFRRDPEDTWETISFGSHYKGGQKRIPFFPNNSYLGKAGNNAAGAEIVRSVYQYFERLLHIKPNSPLFTGSFLDNDDSLNTISDFLAGIDTGIIGIERKENAHLEEIKASIPQYIPKEIREEIINRSKYQFNFSHLSDEGKVIKIPLTEESYGTQRLFSFLPLLISSFLLGSVLIVDELDSSFHPHLAELIIRLFNDPTVNTNNAQLIFTTHDIKLMSPQLMRRDQIWFTEKSEGATSFYSLDEFDKSTVKSNSPYSDWYDEGRFGALPHIKYEKIKELFAANL